jgi:hypothetical protein
MLEIFYYFSIISFIFKYYVLKAPFISNIYLAISSLICIMKKSMLFFFIFLSFIANAQKKTTYYDYTWKPCAPELARFIAVIENTDSGFFKRNYYVSKSSLQMQGLYKDSTCKIENGCFSYFYPNGKLLSIGKYINKLKEGLWLNYHYNGVMQDSTTYLANKKSGISMGWHQNGFPWDSIDCDKDGKAVEVYWFDNGQPFAFGRTVKKTIW